MPPCVTGYRAAIGSSCPSGRRSARIIASCALPPPVLRWRPSAHQQSVSVSRVGARKPGPDWREANGIVQPAAECSLNETVVLQDEQPPSLQGENTSTSC